MSLQLQQFRVRDLAPPKRGKTGFVLTMGRKAGRGIDPKSVGRFWVTLDQVGMDESRPLHPLWQRLNSAPPDQRITFDAVLGHHKLDNVYQVSHRCHRAAGKILSPPHNGPACYGDGKVAERWTQKGCATCGGAGGSEKTGRCVDCRGTSDGYVQIPCPGLACEFSIGDVAPCGPKLRLMLWPAPSELERWGLDPLKHQLSGRLETGGLASYQNFVGMLADVEELAESLGIPVRSWMGLPVQISIGRRKRSEVSATGGRNKISKYPVLGFAMGATIRVWLQGQAEALAQLGAGEAMEPAGLLAAEFHKAEYPDEIEKPAPEPAIEGEVVEEAEPPTAKPAEPEAEKPKKKAPPTRADKEAWITKEARRLRLPLEEMVDDVRGGEGTVPMGDLKAGELDELGEAVKKEVLADKERKAEPGMLPLEGPS